MAVLVTCRFEDDSIKSEGAIPAPENIFSIIREFFFVVQGRVSQKWIVRSGLKSNSSEILWLSSLPASMTKIRSCRYPRSNMGFFGTKGKILCLSYLQVQWRSDKKMKTLSIGQHFPQYKSMGAFGCHGNQSFDPISPKTLCSLSPTPMMLHIKFDKDWPTGLRDIQIWKRGRWTTTTDSGPLPPCKHTA